MPRPRKFIVALTEVELRDLMTRVGDAHADAGCKKGALDCECSFARLWRKLARALAPTTPY